MDKETKEFIKDIVTREEKEEQAKKEKKEKKKKSVVVVIIDIILWVLLFAWITICLIDYFRVKDSKEPKFCIKSETKTYDDGNVKSCLGLGYKVYTYKLENYNGVEFGPFWIDEKTFEE